MLFLEDIFNSIMTKKIKSLTTILILVILTFNSCKSLNEEDRNITTHNIFDKESVDIDTRILNLSKEISIDRMKSSVRVLSHDSMEGRNTGSIGQKKAAKFIKDFYIAEEIDSPKGLEYYQKIPEHYFNGKTDCDSENVMAFVEGTELAEEVIVISAHYDHLGINKDGEIFNGADDNGSGNAALMEMARLFKKAKDSGYGPKRSVLFLHVTGEEIGLYGSKYYVEHSIYPLSKTLVNLNVDMIGRVDEKHLENSNYIYLVGSDRLSLELHDLNEIVNEKYVGLDLDYKFNKPNEPKRIFYRSDHYNFAKNNIPVIFFFSGLHKDYHKTTDTFEKLSFDLIKKRSQLIFLTAWEVINKPRRLKI